MFQADCFTPIITFYSFDRVMVLNGIVQHVYTRGLNSNPHHLQVMFCGQGPRRVALASSPPVHPGGGFQTLQEYQ